MEHPSGSSGSVTDALPATVEVTMENFESIVDANPIVILDFWAAWCQPCKIFLPVYEQVARENPDVVFGKVNTEVAKDLAEAFRVLSIPTVMAFKNAELVFEQAGVLSPAMIQELIRRLKADTSG